MLGVFAEFETNLRRERQLEGISADQRTCVAVKIYPGARHGFDSPRPPHSYAGHYVGQDPAALADALVETRRFLDERLIPQTVIPGDPKQRHARHLIKNPHPPTRQHTHGAERALRKIRDPC